MTRTIKGALKRLLAAAGMARPAHAESERHLVAEVRTAERARASREIAAANARLAELTDKLHATHERLAAEDARSNALRRELTGLRRTEAMLPRRPAALRRLKLAQIAIGAKAGRRAGVTRGAARRAARLASISAEYAAAASRWRAGDVPAGVDRVAIARLQWSVPSAAADEMSQRILEKGELPLDELAAVRDVAVGGIMLDIGAQIGTTSIPRILLGDFARVYAAEPDSAAYLCLVRNTLDNGCEGRVLPHRVAIGGSAGPGTVRRPDGSSEDVPFLTVDAWMMRLGVALRNIRFVRIALQPWNMDIERGAAYLLKQRHVVWQIDIGPVVAGASGAGARRACERLAAHFTHVQELGCLLLSEPRPASDAGDIVGAGSGGANFLLFNMHGDIRRSDAARATETGS